MNLVTVYRGALKCECFNEQIFMGKCYYLYRCCVTNLTTLLCSKSQSFKGQKDSASSSHALLIPINGSNLELSNVNSSAIDLHAIG